MKHHRFLSLGLCFVCMLSVSACTSAPRLDTPVCVALALEEDTELLLALQMPTPTVEPLQPTPEPTPEPTPVPTPTPSPEPTVKPTAKPQRNTATKTRSAAAERTPAPSPVEMPQASADAETPVSDALPVALPSADYSLEELELAAKVAYLEARGKGEEAYRAVLSVIYNRCKSTKFGRGETSISTEVYRKSQFSVIGHSKFETMVPPAEIVDYAHDVFCNDNPNIPEGVLFFRAARLGQGWGGKTYYKTIGGNAFYYGS